MEASGMDDYEISNYKTTSGIPISSNMATLSVLKCVTRTGYVMSIGKSSSSSGSGSGSW